jgi:hypothetical protein
MDSGLRQNDDNSSIVIPDARERRDPESILKRAYDQNGFRRAPE